MKKIATLLLSMLSLFYFNVNADENHGNKANYQPYLKVQEVREEGLLLQLDDGSEWDIQYYGGLWRIIGYGWVEQKNVSHWAVGDLIEIKYPANGNFFDFHLAVFNLTKDEKALVTLKQAPSNHHGSSLWIAYYNDKNNHFTLSDGTVWVKGKKDSYGAFFGKKEHTSSPWLPGDPVTLLTIEGFLNKGKILCWNHASNEMPDIHPIH